jgi:hypothetical protein
MRFLSIYVTPCRPRASPRQQGQPKAVRDISWRAQLRLTKRFRHLRIGRKLPQNKVCVAVARELSGFVWDIARQVKPLA